MLLTYDQQIHLVPVARPSITRANTALNEWSERGRDPRFMPGWYILPSLAVAVLTLAFIVL